jgi:hypothetical protein
LSGRFTEQTMTPTKPLTEASFSVGARGRGTVASLHPDDAAQGVEGLRITGAGDEASTPQVIPP